MSARGHGTGEVSKIRFDLIDPGRRCGRDGMCCLFDDMAAILLRRRISAHCNRMALLLKQVPRGTVLGALTLRMSREHGRILEDTMKKLALAAALSVVATGAFAGGVVQPVVEPVVIVEDTSSSAGGILVPILAIILIAAAVAAND
jgi:hypothetical protein